MQWERLRKRGDLPSSRAYTTVAVLDNFVVSVFSDASVCVYEPWLLTPILRAITTATRPLAPGDVWWLEWQV